MSRAVIGLPPTLPPPLDKLHNKAEHGRPMEDVSVVCVAMNARHTVMPMLLKTKNWDFEASNVET